MKLKVLALSLLVCSAPTLAQTDKGTFVTDSYKPVVMTQRNQMVAQCVRAMQSRWPKAARLMLDTRGRLRQEANGRVFSAGGYVWRSGERVRVEHDCVSYDGREDVALAVNIADEELFAAN